MSDSLLQRILRCPGSSGTVAEKDAFKYRQRHTIVIGIRTRALRYESNRFMVRGSDLELRAQSSFLELGAQSSLLELRAQSSSLELGAQSSLLELRAQSSFLELGAQS
ncbi:hypothetical protein FOL47_002950, partial [Perkinsus chesapeaki]